MAITDTDQFLTVLREAAAAGYARDDEEQEAGVRCVAVAVPTTGPPLAVSTSTLSRT